VGEPLGLYNCGNKNENVALSFCRYLHILKFYYPNLLGYRNFPFAKFEATLQPIRPSMVKISAKLHCWGLRKFGVTFSRCPQCNSVAPGKN